MADQTVVFGDKPVDKLLRWLSVRPEVALVLMVAVALGPFITKPFNFDDPLFLWAARQIHAHPANPYGFELNWYGTVANMWETTQNPPLACYYLALAAAILGWSEPALHFAFLLPAIAAILGTYRLALQFSNRPMFAACATLFTPVFLVSSTTVMCDTLMLAFWVWAMVLWVEGLKRDHFRILAVSGLLIVLASFTKYFGACLIPLLAAYSLITRRRLGQWTIALLIPLVALAAYQSITCAVYGKGLLSAARDYAVGTGVPVGIADMARRGMIALSFTGGCLAVATFLAPWLWRLRALAGLCAFAVLTCIAVFAGTAMLRHYANLPTTKPWWLGTQIVFWAFGGISILSLAAADVWRRRDAGSWLLALWVAGTFLFAGFLNWIVNGRSILPMAPAVAILLARRLERNTPVAGKDRNDIGFPGRAAGAIVAMLVANADFHLAKAARLSAEQTYARYVQPGQVLWFQGHWGFQYYIQRLDPNAKAINSGQSQTNPGDLVAVPLNNSNVRRLNTPLARPWKALKISGPRWLSTNSEDVGAGFYASLWGPLPFAVGRVPPETVLVYVVGQRPDNPSGQPVR
jgi:4-amino-4-deoxy-L-arabinose transferase-like glycosyltransferase